MPKGPQGQKRPADVIGAAIRVARIATGEEDDEAEAKGSAGGEARARKLTAKERSAIAKKAANTRWQKSPAAQAERERS